ncbi:MAG: DUF465 domain-containing protein [Proteobacteria bacterium]|nr:DUF465 domain-containing protein [Pseudomonadota bacterium]
MDENDLKAKLSSLREEHRDLDDAITALTRAGTFDRLQLQRLKKKKLRVKDQIGKLKDDLFPDIIA